MLIYGAERMKTGGQVAFRRLVRRESCALMPFTQKGDSARLTI
jgi:hypothetical protein